MWDVSRTACGKIAASSAPKCLNYRGNFIVQSQFTNLAAGCGLEIHGLVFSFSKNVLNAEFITDIRKMHDTGFTLNALKIIS